MKLTILIKLTDAIVGLGQVVKTVEVEDGSLIHMETRDPRQDPDVVSMEVLLTVEVMNSLNLIVLTIFPGGEGANCAFDEEITTVRSDTWGTCRGRQEKIDDHLCAMSSS